MPKIIGPPPCFIIHFAPAGIYQDMVSTFHISAQFHEDTILTTASKGGYIDHFNMT